MTVAILFARKDSIYKDLAGLDVFDIDRDALNFKGGMPVIAHPPCRGWGRLKHFAKPLPGELDLARFSVSMVRQNGGVLEHPNGSSLWIDQSLPAPGEIDSYGGFTYQVFQHDFGHKAKKSILLYICGLTLEQMPKPMLSLSEPGYVVAKSRDKANSLPEISRSEREATPADFANYLLGIASQARPGGTRL